MKRVVFVLAIAFAFPARAQVRSPDEAFTDINLLFDILRAAGSRA